MHTRGFVAAGACLVLLSALLTTVADSNAYFLLERNANQHFGLVPPPRLAFVLSHLSLQDLLIVLVVSIPSVVSLALLHGFRKRQWFVLAALAGLACLDFAVLLAADGGDYKGCTLCIGPFLWHSGLSVLSLSIALATLGIRFLSRGMWKQRGRPSP